MSDLIKLLDGYLDADEFPGTIQCDGTYDGGDTAAIMGTVDFFDSTILHEMAPWHPVLEVPIRHPDESRWYGQPDRYSRDQLIPQICYEIKRQNSDAALALLDLYGTNTCRLYEAHKRKYFLTAWNTRGNGALDMPTKMPDICGPEIWALWLRYRKPWWMRLVLGILDVQTLIGAIQWRWFTPKTNQITRNHMLVCLVMKQYSPTYIGNLTNRINDWNDLVNRWELCNKATGEYPTYQLFKKELNIP